MNEWILTLTGFISLGFGLMAMSKGVSPVPLIASAMILFSLSLYYNTQEK